MRIHYTRDQYGRRIPRRTRDRACDDCGHTYAPTRQIRFNSTGMLYQVCADHEHEYCGTPKQRAEHWEGHPATIVPVGV